MVRNIDVYNAYISHSIIIRMYCWGWLDSMCVAFNEWGPGVVYSDERWVTVIKHIQYCRLVDYIPQGHIWFTIININIFDSLASIHA